MEPHVMALNSDVDVLSRLYRILTEAGCRTATYSSAAAACRYAEVEMPDAILTTMDYPGYARLQIVQDLRAVCPETRILVLAPLHDIPNLELVERAGADFLLSCDASDDELRSFVLGILQAGGLRAEKEATC